MAQRKIEDQSMEMESPVEIESEERRSNRRLNNIVAITIALLATFIGIARIKTDNLFLAMQEAQADRIDNYMWYQARNIREDVAQATAIQLSLHSASQPPGVRAVFARQANIFSQIARREEAKKQRQIADAQKAEQTYKRFGIRREQLDLSGAVIAVAIAILAITSLTQRMWLYFVGLIPAVFGLIMGVAGFAGWSIHPEALMRFLQP
jgi:hypothetical protein